MPTPVVEDRGTSVDVLRFSYGDLVQVEAPKSRWHGRTGAVIDVAGYGSERRWLIFLDACEDVWLADSALVVAS